MSTSELPPTSSAPLPSPRLSSHQSNTCFSDFIRCYRSILPARRAPRPCVYASRKRIGCTSLSRDTFVCARAHPTARRRGYESPVLDRWIPTCLLTKGYRIVATRRSVRVLTLRCAPPATPSFFVRVFFSHFTRTLSSRNHRATIIRFATRRRSPRVSLISRVRTGCAPIVFAFRTRCRSPRHRVTTSRGGCYPHVQRTGNKSDRGP